MQFFQTNCTNNVYKPIYVISCNMTLHIKLVLLMVVQSHQLSVAATMLPLLSPQRLLLGCVRSRKCSAQYKYNTCTLTELGFHNAHGMSVDNDTPCSRTPTSLTKPLSFGDRPTKTTAQLADTAPDTCSMCSEHRKSAYQSSGIKCGLLPISSNDYSIFSTASHGFHNSRRSVSSVPRERCGCHPVAIPRRNATSLSCWTRANACSLPSRTTAPVRWCSSRAVVGGNVIPLEHSKPVQTGEIKKFLSENEFVHREGYTCLISTCPRHVRRKIRLSELDRLYINLTTGTWTFVQPFKSSQQSLVRHKTQCSSIRFLLDETCIYCMAATDGSHHDAVFKM